MKLRDLAAASFVVAVFYALSVGPSFAVMRHVVGRDSHGEITRNEGFYKVVTTIYAPILWLDRSSDAFDGILTQYVEMWVWDGN